MTITPMLQFIQDRILLSIYPLCSIEEARRREVILLGCIITSGEDYHEIVDNHYELGTIATRRMGAKYGEASYDGQETNNTDIQILDEIDEDFENFGLFFDEIIGLPPTLSRVLTALGREYVYIPGYITLAIDEDVCMERKLLNSDGTDATLFDQSEETQLAIALLLGRETVKLDERYMFVKDKGEPIVNVPIVASTG